MTPDEDGLPRIGSTGRTLGARSGYPNGGTNPDIRITPAGKVYPRSGGMSVAMPPADNLPPHRRPPSHGGTDKKIALYELETEDLPDELQERIDPYNSERHVFIEPAQVMSFEDYQQALHATRRLWRPVRYWVRGEHSGTYGKLNGKPIDGEAGAISSNRNASG